MKKAKSLWLVMLLLAVLYGCGGGGGGSNDDCDNCYNSIADAKEDYGNNPECSSVEYGDGTWCYSCWWWARGIEKTFCQWRSCGCDVTTYTFPPIVKTTEYRDDDLDLKFSEQRFCREDSSSISFASFTTLFTEPKVGVLTPDGNFDCSVDFVVHESGGTTGIISIPTISPVELIYFNGRAIEMKGDN